MTNILVLSFLRSYLVSGWLGLQLFLYNKPFGMLASEQWVSIEKCFTIIVSGKTLSSLVVEPIIIPWEW
jgi:hypothetical protein